MASFFVQQLDLLSLTSPPTFDRRGQSAPSAKQFSPRAFSLAGATDDEGAGGGGGRGGLIRKAVYTVYTMKDL